MAPTLHALFRLGIGRTITTLADTGNLVRYRVRTPSRGVRPVRTAAIGALSEAELRRLIDKTYRKLDRRNPSPGLREQYYKLVEELDCRSEDSGSGRDYP